MGCHQRADRSFSYNGKPFPICARCTGIIVGTLLSVISFWFIEMDKVLLFISLLPMVIDGTVQRFGKYESNNTRRFLTGLLFGYAFIYLFFMSVAYAYRLGFNLGIDIKQKLV